MNPEAANALNDTEEKEGYHLGAFDVIFSQGSFQKHICSLQGLFLGFQFIKKLQLVTSHYLQFETLSTNSTSAYHLAYLHERTIANNNHALYYSYIDNNILKSIVNILLRTIVRPLNSQSSFFQKRNKYLHFTGSRDSR